MAQRLKTKVSPCSFRLNDEARKALVIEEAENPNKTRGQIIGELIIAKVTGKTVPPPIEFAEFSAEEMLALRVINAENMKVADRFRAAARHATPKSNKDAFYLEIAKEAKAAVESCKTVSKKLVEMSDQAASVKAETLFNLKDIYEKTTKLRENAVKKIDKDPEARARANMWGELANFVRIFLPEVGPEINILTAPVKEIKKVKEETKPQLQEPQQPQQQEKGEFETFETATGGYKDA